MLIAWAPADAPRRFLESALDEERTARHASLRRDKQRIELAYELTGCPVPCG